MTVKCRVVGMSITSSSNMSAQKPFLDAARQCLSVGRKSFSGRASLDLATHTLAIDLGLKPALLYDLNRATADQVYHYVHVLQSLGAVSKSLAVLDIGGDAMIVNVDAAVALLKQALFGSGTTVIDIGTVAQIAVAELLPEKIRSMLQDVVAVLQTCNGLTPLSVRSEGWNLCTLFGFLLGYPFTYWFDPGMSSGDSLSMVQLSVTNASVSWPAESGSSCCIYSFSYPTILHSQTRSALDSWGQALGERFHKQNVLRNLTITQSTVVLPSVCL